MRREELNLAARDAEATEAPRVEVYEYPSGAGAGSRSTTPHAGVLYQGGVNTPQDGADRGPSDSARAEFDRRLAEETRRSFEAGREQGRSEGRQAEREAQAGAVVSAERERLRKAAELVDRFDREREGYFAQVEREVVALALAIAARILRREAQMDPLLLTGAVRVALGQLSASKEAIAHAPTLAIRPSVVSGEGMRLGECVIKTDLGTVDLGIRRQLGEIESGFFDRVGDSPAALSVKDSSGREAGT